ncbi:MAG TPA: 3-isopropylmalate dehydratase small subunit, partial [Gammaproteobacteria bacterium]|nr:3-isopropylmalate dehydratase small subunit [Gammaproteobacteria bacterium]
DGDQVHDFDIDPALKEKMLHGMDDIDLTLAEASLIRDFEAGHRQRQPWLFRD